jgi:hypothetical protein
MKKPDFYTHEGPAEMGNQQINWIDLSDSQKATLLKQAKAYLQQQKAQAKLSKSVASVLAKHELT